MKIKRPKIFKITSIVLAVAFLTVFIYQQGAHAAAISGISDTMSNLNASGTSNHDIQFRTPSGLSGTTKTITINFNTASFTSGTTAFGDIDLQYGSSQAQVNGSCSSGCASATLAASAGSGAWGAAIAGNILHNVVIVIGCPKLPYTVDTVLGYLIVR